MPKRKVQSKTRKRIPNVDLHVQSEEDQVKKDLQKTDTKSSKYSYQILRQKTIQYLGGNQIPKVFNHRQKQIKQITEYIENCFNKKNKSKYKILMITGSPGAGKSLSVNHILNEMQMNKVLKVIKFNANVIKNVRDAQQIICEKILNIKYGNHMSTLQIIRNLEEQKIKQKYVLYIQEIQVILQQKANIFTEDFFQLFSNPKIDIMLLGISNTIDAMVKYSSSISLSIHEIKNIVFQPYQLDAMVKILKQKIQYVQNHFDIKVIASDKVLSFAAAKLQNLKRGDIRIVLEYLKQLFKKLLPQKLQQTLSINEQGYVVTTKLAHQVLAKMTCSKYQIIVSLPSMQQMVLIAVYLQIVQENSLYVNLKQLQAKMKWICTSLGLQLQPGLILTSLQILQQYCLISRDQKSKDVRIMLKVSCADVKASLQEHSLFKRFFEDQEKQQK